MLGDHYLGVCYHQEMPCAGGRNVLKMLLINTPVCSRSCTGLGKAEASAALLLFTCISSFPGAAVLSGAQGCWGFMWGSQPPRETKADNHKFSGSIPQLPPQGFFFSLHCSSAKATWVRGWRIRAKGTIQQPPARRQTQGRAGSWLQSSWRSTFFKKKNNAQQTCRVFRPCCQAILSLSAGLGPPATPGRVSLWFLIKGQKLEAAGNRPFAQMCNSLYSEGQTGHGKGKGSPGDAEMGKPSWASEGEKLLKLCFPKGKGLGVTQTFTPTKLIFWMYSWECLWEHRGKGGQDGW